MLFLIPKSASLESKRSNNRVKLSLQNFSETHINLIKLSTAFKDFSIKNFIINYKGFSIKKFTILSIIKFLEMLDSFPKLS